MITLSITDSHNPNLEILSHLKRFQLFEFNSFQHFSHLQTTFFPLLEAVTLGMGNILPWKDEYDISINTATFFISNSIINSDVELTVSQGDNSKIKQMVNWLNGRNINKRYEN